MKLKHWCTYTEIGRIVLKSSKAFSFISVCILSINVINIHFWITFIRIFTHSSYFFLLLDFCFPYYFFIIIIKQEIHVFVFLIWYFRANFLYLYALFMFMFKIVGEMERHCLIYLYLRILSHIYGSVSLPLRCKV